MRHGKPIKNKRRIDPRYFLYEEALHEGALLDFFKRIFRGGAPQIPEEDMDDYLMTTMSPEEWLRQKAAKAAHVPLTDEQIDDLLDSLLTPEEKASIARELEQSKERYAQDVAAGKEGERRKKEEEGEAYRKAYEAEREADKKKHGVYTRGDIERIAYGDEEAKWRGVMRGKK